MISVIIHDLRSIHNVGSILRTCDGFGVGTVYIGGTSPYPRVPDDNRLPHAIDKQTREIAKTALGAEASLNIVHYDDIIELIRTQKKSSTVLALEQTDSSVPINTYKATGNLTLLLGREVEGIDPELLKLCDSAVVIPMHGSKESFNVAVATGIALYALTLYR